MVWDEIYFKNNFEMTAIADILNIGKERFV